jgi:hypothetical protein
LGYGLEGEGAGFFDCGCGLDDVEAVGFTWGDLLVWRRGMMQRGFLVFEAARYCACCMQR